MLFEANQLSWSKHRNIKTEKDQLKGAIVEAIIDLD